MMRTQIIGNSQHLGHENGKMERSKAANPKASLLNRAESGKKIVIRYLPADLAEKEFYELISPNYSQDNCTYKYYVKGKISQDNSKPPLSSTAYFGFKQESQAKEFKQNFDASVFSGQNSQPVVEFAPFQAGIRLSKPDSLAGTIQQDNYYKEFIASLTDPNASVPSLKVPKSGKAAVKTKKKEKKADGKAEPKDKASSNSQKSKKNDEQSESVKNKEPSKAKDATKAKEDKPIKQTETSKTVEKNTEKDTKKEKPPKKPKKSKTTAQPAKPPDAPASKKGNAADKPPPTGPKASKKKKSEHPETTKKDVKSEPKKEANKGAKKDGNSSVPTAPAAAKDNSIPTGPKNKGKPVNKEVPKDPKLKETSESKKAT